MPGPRERTLTSRRLSRVSPHRRHATGAAALTYVEEAVEPVDDVTLGDV